MEFLRSLDEAKQVAGKIFAAMGLSDIRGSALTFAAHQIGTHRMGTDPRASVVDANLRAHDVPNLYLVGSGTLTIAALAIRGRPSTSRSGCALIIRG